MVVVGAAVVVVEAAFAIVGAPVGVVWARVVVVGVTVVVGATVIVDGTTVVVDAGNVVIVGGEVVVVESAGNDGSDGVDDCCNAVVPEALRSSLFVSNSNKYSLNYVMLTVVFTHGMKMRVS